METKEILLLLIAFVALGFSIYKKYTKKNGQSKGDEKKSIIKKGGLSSQPDDYEPYSGKKS
jgi:hypothetical protein